jgi:hypothetical protein
LFTCLLAAAAGTLCLAWPATVEGWLGVRPDVWWLAGLLGLVCLVGLGAGLRLVTGEHSTQPAPSRAWSGEIVDQSHLVPVEAVETDSSEAAPTTTAPAYWPPDQAVGIGWLKASDAVRPQPSPE